jgi:hypothetical protein
LTGILVMVEWREKVCRPEAANNLSKAVMTKY